MQVLCSPYNEDVQFADFLNVHPPPKKKKKKKRRYFHALPLVALAPLANYLHINHNSISSFKMYILFLFKAQTMNEEVLGFKSMLPQMGALMPRARVKTFPCPALMYA